MFPTKERWRRWSLPTKLTYISFWLAVFSFFVWLVGCVNGCIQKPNQITPNISTKIVSRRYARTDIAEFAKSDKVNIPFKAQEVFYEWTLKISTTKALLALDVQLENLQKDDRVMALPENTTISAALPKWFSGFPEPQRKKPDYYIRNISFRNLSKENSGVVRVRRTLSELLIPESLLIRLGGIRPSDGLVIAHKYDTGQDSKRLSEQARKLGMSLPIASDPGDVTIKDAQATIEVWCKDDVCDQLIMGQLEARLGKSPAEIEKDRLQIEYQKKTNGLT